MATTAENMVAALETALASNVGVSSITVDGLTISYQSRAQMLSELRHWKDEVAKQSGKRPRAATIGLSGAW